MNSKLNKNQIERFSRQIILKNIGPLGQKKILLKKKSEISEEIVDRVINQIN